MSTPGGGPLAALIRFYERLQADRKIPEFGFAVQPASYCLLLEPSGKLADEPVVDIRDTVPYGKPGNTKQVPRKLTVPFRGNRSGQKPPPNFLCDNTGYLLGVDKKTKKDLLKWKNSESIAFHEQFQDEIDDPAFTAVCSFLGNWKPELAKQFPNWEELDGSSFVFRIRGQKEFVHERPKVRAAWSRFIAAAEKPRSGTSLISGEVEPLAELHEPAIKGIIDPGGQAEKRLVSFNADAFESYGQEGGFNAPIGVQHAFQYTTALNHLLCDEHRRIGIGDATVVFWTDSPAAEPACAWFKSLLSDAGSKSAEDAQTVDQVHNFLQAARSGRLSDVSDPQAPFYILGLSPNASRLNVRFWLVATVEQFVNRLLRHDRDLEIVGREDEPPLSIRRILWETARDPKDIPPQLAGEVIRSILSGRPYPQFLFNAIVQRIRSNSRNRAESELNPRRAAVLKALLIRNFQLEVPVSLDPQHPDQAYQLGRLFAALEKTQEDSTDGKLNSTIKDRYFSAAGATPASVFPILLKLHRHHLAKLDPPGRRVNREKLMSEIMNCIRSFPAFLSLEKQGLFYIAYYHQRHDFFTKKEPASQETNNE